MRVSEIGVGCWAFGGVGWGPVDDRESIAAIRRAVELGVTFFDTADSYGGGHSEEILGLALAEAPAETVVCTKGGILPEPSRQDFSAAHLERALDASLRRLRRERIEMYLLHNPDRETLLRGDAYDALERFAHAGKIAHWGVSIRPGPSWRTPPSGASEDPVDDARWVIENGRASAVELVYNMLEPAAAVVFDRAVAQGVAVIARVPLASGLLSGRITRETTFPHGDFRRRWPRDRLESDLASLDRIRALSPVLGFDLAQAALRFCLAHPAVAVTIPGARNARQAEHNAAASFLASFREEDVAQIVDCLRVPPHG